ncbi:MAG TPA: hypothetical protein VF315_08040, partial [Steroidobacteraceae bacterium]
ATIPEFSDSELFALEDESDEAQAARHTPAARLRALRISAAQLSDRLTMRHFAHTGDSQSVWT